MVESCPRCGRPIREEDAVFCAYCGSSFRQGVFGRTDFPTVGGVLMVIAVSVCVLAAVLAFVIFLSTYSYRYYSYSYPYYSGYYSPRYWDLAAGGVGILAFVYGLAAGIFSLKRRKFVHCLVGGIVTVAEGFLLVLAFAQQWDNSWGIGLTFGVPIIILSSTGLLFISLSKNEYR